MILSAKAQAAINAKLALGGNNANIENVGSFGDFMLAFGAKQWSGIRQNEGKNPYIVLYDAENRPFTVMFSQSIAKEHAAQPFERDELLQNPVYMTSVKLADGSDADIFSIGIEGKPKDDVDSIDFVALKLTAAPAPKTRANKPA